MTFDQQCLLRWETHGVLAMLNALQLGLHSVITDLNNESLPVNDERHVAEALGSVADSLRAHADHRETANVHR